MDELFNIEKVFTDNREWVFVLLIIFGWLLNRGAKYAYVRLPSRGVLPAIFRLTSLSLRLMVIVLTGILVVGVSTRFGKGVAVAIIAVLAVAIWSARDILPDLVAGAVLIAERRIRPGTWISGPNYSGVVVWIGLRATWLRDTTDRRISVPNRALLSQPIVSEGSKWPMSEMTLRLSGETSAESARAAIRDAILTSPWTPTDSDPVIRRDSNEPEAWHIRARILDLRFSARFEGELLERTEEHLIGTGS